MTETSSPIYILGTGGQGRVVASIAVALGRDIAGFLDNKPASHDQQINRIPVLGHYQQIAALSAPHVVVAVGNNAARARVTAELIQIQPSVVFPTLIHPRASVEWQATFGAGSVLCAGAVLGTNVKAGKGLILNTLASVDHDCVLGDFVHISPGTHLAGGVHVGHHSWIGIGASVIEGVRIGQNVTIGAGAAVIHDIPDNVTVVGVPAKKLI